MAGNPNLSLITDLDICETETGPVLYATTRYGGSMNVWDISGTGLA